MNKTNETILVYLAVIITLVVFCGSVVTFLIEKQVTKAYCHKHYKVATEEYNMCLWSKHYTRIKGD